MANEISPQDLNINSNVKRYETEVTKSMLCKPLLGPTEVIEETMQDLNKDDDIDFEEQEAIKKFIQMD